MQRPPQSEEILSYIVPIGKEKLSFYCLGDILVADNYTFQVIKFDLAVIVRKMIPVSELPSLVRIDP